MLKNELEEPKKLQLSTLIKVIHISLKQNKVCYN